MNIFEKGISVIFGTKHEQDIKRMKPIVESINAREAEIEALDDAELRSRFSAIRERVQASTKDLPKDARERSVLVQGVLDPEFEEVFALVREASRRTLGMRHFDVQLMGGLVLHEGRIAEMRTGEGKTLAATLPVALNALAGRGVHVVTVNDYLARRDAEWMGQIYEFLGLSVGCIQNQMNDLERKEAYAADVTYGTNNEFGFDYLRDNMKFDLERMVQREHVYAIVDEVDSILVDEARTPLIISGPSEVSVDLYYKVDTIVPRLTKGEEIEDKHGNKETTGDYLVDEKGQTASLTDPGMARAEKLLAVDNLYDPSNIEILHAVNQALRAHTLFHRDKEYIVKDGEVTIVDEFTGRLMSGRRWSDGLHQAVEAKEKGPRRVGGPDQPTDDPSRSRGCGLQDWQGEIPGGDRRDPGVQPERAAGVGGHGLDRELREAVKAPTEAQDQTRCPQRQVPRERGRHHRPGWPPGGGDHRHQHGGAWHRHRPRR